MRFRALFVSLVAAAFCGLPALCQADKPTPAKQQPPKHDVTTAPPKGPKEDLAAVARGEEQFKSSCGFCHGNDATGGRGPDLIRSSILSHDKNGDQIEPVIRNGRPDKGMPAFPTLKQNEVDNIVAFLHHQAYEALHSAHVPGDYPLAKLLTGSADAGKAYFNGAGGCSGCHSVTGDLAGIATKYSPIDLQQHMVYPAREDNITATVTLSNGQKYDGKVTHNDEFRIGIVAQDGWHHSWPKDQVKVAIHDPLAAHRELMQKYTDADIHNLFAYLETLK
jgi:cytochrome c oxidase cbb3-type subunit 3